MIGVNSRLWDKKDWRVQEAESVELTLSAKDAMLGCFEA